jgi:hypothetical protein
MENIWVRYTPYRAILVAGSSILPSHFVPWDFMGHLISNHSTCESANRIRHLGSIDSNAGLLSIGQAQEIMRSSRIKQNNDRVLVQKERTVKNLLTKRNLLQRSEVGTTNPRRRWVDHNLQLTDRWWQGPRSETLLRLGTLTGEVPNLPTVEAQKPYPSRLWSSRWSSQPRVDERTWGHLLRWTLAPLLR